MRRLPQLMRLSCTLLVCALSAFAHTKTVRVATLQFESVNGAFEQNLETITLLLQQAKAQEAQLALLPELALIGYELAPAIWNSGEPLIGPSLSALSALAKDNQLYLGTTLLEAKGEHFYNTFVLLGPTGQLLGRVRKQKPAGAEAYFFNSAEDRHVIDSPLGAVGVGICQENYRCFLPKQLHNSGADFVLMPFSYPDLSNSGGLASPKGSYIASWYAAQLGIPVVTSNKTGIWPQVKDAFFPGNSAIAAAGGAVLGELDDSAGVLVVDIELDPGKKRKPTADCIGPFLQDLTLGTWLQKRTTWAMIWLSELFGYSPQTELEASYLNSSQRRDAALSLQAIP